MVAGPSLAVTMDLDRGAVITELIDLVTGRNWLVPPAFDPDVKYGDSYTEGRPIYGWDEIMPSIDECTVSGQLIPDHGDLWSVPWHMDDAVDGRHWAVCRSLPLQLSRTISPIPDGLRLDYSMRNIGSSATPAFWCSHPMFAVSERVVVTVGSGIPTRVAPPVLGRGEANKRWYQGADAVLIEDQGERLRIVCSGLPSVSTAVLWDNHRYADGYAIAVEPATHAGDSLVTGLEQQSALVLDAAESIQWSLSVTTVSES